MELAVQQKTGQTVVDIVRIADDAILSEAC